MHKVGYRTVKSPVCVNNKFKIAHNFFMTNATDIKTFDLFDLFLAFFSTLPSTQATKVIDLFFQ